MALPPNKGRKRLIATAVGILGVILLAVVALSLIQTNGKDGRFPFPRRFLLEESSKHKKIKVFGAFVDNPVAQKERRIMAASQLLERVALTPQEQQEYLQDATSNCGETVVERYKELMQNQKPHLAQEVWKYCALYQEGGVYLDGESPLIINLETLLHQYQSRNIAVLSEKVAFPNTLHGSLLLVRKSRSKVSREMLKLLLNTPIDTLDSSPLLLPRRLFQLVASYESNNRKWVLLDQQCTINPLRHDVDNSPSLEHQRLTHVCPKNDAYCCHVHDDSMGMVLMTKHPLLPYQVLPNPSTLPKPYNDADYSKNDLPFIATLTETVFSKPDDFPETPNFYDVLKEKKCLPDSKECSSCLREKKGATCETCSKPCSHYCKHLCTLPLTPKFVSKELIVTPPRYSKDPNRMIPRLIHQTWFEQVTPTKYPNMARLMESWKRSGWEYKFWNDEDAALFIQLHFPPQVHEAYVALNPGAFKADLFRYCVLLIHGGVYADMDVILESNLDAVVGPDVGFMVPSDEPGKQVEKRMCLWNGFIAVTPGHPFLARVIETIVNNIRNRFTSVDMDNTFCPDPELSILHAYDTLFTAGPCILGGTINKLLGRHGQTHYEPGQVNVWSDDLREAAMESTSFVTGLEDSPELRIPGRTIVLKQNKWDMGAHRFTLLEKNMVVAATDMPEYDDRENLDEDDKHENEHYSKTHVRIGVYGLEMLYKDQEKANEDIRILVNGHGNQYKFQY